MFAVTVQFQVRPGHQEEFLTLMYENARTSLLDELECHQFDVCTDPARPYEVFLYELYSNEDAFQSHLTTDHFKSFDAAVAPIIADKTVRTYTQVLQ